jgi:hypothetical protein
MSKVYILGDMLTKGSQLLREKERKDIQRVGLEFYNPMENKEINDKSKVDNDGLAEKIVKQDTDAIYSSDVVVAEPLPHALGSHVEIGQIKGRKDFAKEVLEMALDNSEQPLVLLDKIIALAEKVNNQKVFPHYEDIRRFEGAGKDEEGDRRSLGINQYVYGVCLDLTDGKGFYEWSDVLEELKKIKKNPQL